MPYTPLDFARLKCYCALYTGGVHVNHEERNTGTARCEPGGGLHEVESIHFSMPAVGILVLNLATLMLAQDQSKDSFSIRVEFGSSGIARALRPNPPDNDPGKVAIIWKSNRRSELRVAADQSKVCDGVSIEAFRVNSTHVAARAGNEEFGGATDFDVDKKEESLAKFDGLNTVGKNNIFVENFCIVVDNCPRFKFTNVIVSDRLRIFHDSTPIRIRLRKPIVDGELVWPDRVAVVIRSSGGVPITGAFFDNPGLRAVQQGTVLVRGLGKDGTTIVLDEGESGRGKLATFIEFDDVVNEEIDFMTGIFCDKNNDATDTVPERGGAESLVALVLWGLKVKVRVFQPKAPNTGTVFLKPIKILCGPEGNREPTQDFKEALKVFSQAFSDDKFQKPFAILRSGNSTPADYEIDK